MGIKKYALMFGAAGILTGLLALGGCGSDDSNYYHAPIGTVTTTTAPAATTTTTAPGATTTTTAHGATTTTTASGATTTTTTPTTTTTTLAGPIVLSPTNTTGTATTGADTFRITAATTAGYTVTINGGFLWSADKIAVPVGSNIPSALAGGVNAVTDGAVSLSWNSNGQIVTINVTGLDSISEGALQSNSVPSLFTTY
jgi:hypothetical protein